MNRREAISAVVGGVLGMGVAQTGRAVEPVVSTKTRDEAIKLLMEARQAQRFTDEPVSDEDIKTILDIARNAPSAHNRQPWFFSVVTDRKLLAEIDKAAKVDPNGRLSLTGSPLVVFVCVERSDVAKYDSGLAAERLNVAAVLLGYGSKTVMTAAQAANEPTFKAQLRVPDEYDVYTAVLIGVERERSVDGVSGATSREPREKKVVFIK
ncbi:MAG: nitroreductase family protein [Thermoguttaceae bacterium]|jgi:hypothetical protein